jgi:hypothetical protein
LRKLFKARCRRIEGRSLDTLKANPYALAHNLRNSPKIRGGIGATQ